MEITKLSKFTIQIHMAKITLLSNGFFPAQPLFGQLPKIPRVPHSLLTFAGLCGAWPFGGSYQTS